MAADTAAFGALVGFLLRLQLVALRRMLVMVVGLGLILYLTGKADDGLIAMLLLCGSGANAMQLAFLVFQTKASGDFEMIAELPVRPSVIAGAFAAAAGIALAPGAVGLAAAARIGFGTIQVAPPPFALLLLGGWLLLWLAAWISVSIGIALSPDAFVRAPVGAIVLLFVLGELLPQPDPRSIIDWLSTPLGSAIAGTAAVLAVIGSAVGLHFLACHGIARYEATPVTPLERWQSRGRWRFRRT